MGEVDNTAENIIGLNKRGVFTNNGTEVGLVGVPLCDIFNMVIVRWSRDQGKSGPEQ